MNRPRRSDRHTLSRKTYPHEIRLYYRDKNNEVAVKYIAEKRFKHLFSDGAMDWFDDIVSGFHADYGVGHYLRKKDTTLAGYHYVDSVGNVYQLV